MTEHTRGRVHYRKTPWIWLEPIQRWASTKTTSTGAHVTSRSTRSTATSIKLLGAREPSGCTASRESKPGRVRDERAGLRIAHAQSDASGHG